MARVVLEQVVKVFEELPVVCGLDLAVAHNEFVVLVGPSGCGKSTTLRMIAGLEEITSGTIWIGDRIVNELRPRERNVSMVFQNYALYPHMTVVENMSFGLKLAKTPKHEIKPRVDEAARILGIDHLLARRPSQLSGGERQRVAMGRAMVRNPDVFLFDEPLSNLDAKLRATMRTEIKRLHQKIQSTMIYVTHDQVEAMTLADRIVIMRDGVIEQLGAPGEVFARPANIFVAGFIGSPPMNFLDATVEEGSLRIGEGVDLPVPEVWRAALTPGAKVTLGMRAEDIVPEGYGQPPTNAWRFESSVSLSEPLGSETLLIVELGGTEIVSKMFNPALIAAGDRLAFQINLDRLHLFDPESGRALG